MKVLKMKIFIVLIVLGFFNCEGNTYVQSKSSLKYFFITLFNSNGVSSNNANNSDSITDDTVEIPTFSPVTGTYNTDQNVSIFSNTEGAVIYYTIDGSEPTTSSTLYNGTISVAGHGTSKTIKAIAVKSGLAKSSVVSATYTINYDTVAEPTFSPVGGTYTSAQNVTISSATSSAEIRYTTNGAEPTCSTGTVYSSVVSVTTITTLKAIGCKTGMLNSSVSSGIFTIDTTIPTITISPITNPYISGNIGSINSKEITWSSNRNGSYSIKLSNDCTSGTILTNGTVSAGANNSYTVQASSLSIGSNSIFVCVTDSISSFIGSSSVLLTRDDTAPTVTATPGNTSSSSIINVTLGCSDSSSGCDKIVYTSNETNPTINGTTGAITNGTQYTSQLTPPDNTTTIYRYIARDQAGNVSTISSSTYTRYSTSPTITINSVNPVSTYINGSTNPQINWQSNESGMYSIKIGGTSCSNATQATGTGNVSGTVNVGSSITSTINNSDLSQGSNSIRICVTDSVGNLGLTTQTITKDTTAPPVAENSGTITTTNITSTGLTLNWAKANDAIFAQNTLQYKVVRSLSNNINTVATAESNGTIVQDWTANIASLSVTNLTANTTYYFNVLVKDGVENKGMYTVVSAAYTIQYTVGGTITGLTSDGLVLQNNGGDNLNIASGETGFTFTTSIIDGGSYVVTVATQPTGKGCTVTNGSGTVSGTNVTNVNINCFTATSETYVWGTFTDNFNGTVKFVGNSGTFGGNSYPSQTLTFMKCSQGQSWNSGTNNCDGSAGNYKYCNVNGFDCNGGINTGSLGTFLNNAISTAYATCNELNFAGKINWRVPTKNELKILIHCANKIMPNDNNNCGTDNFISPSISNLFLNTISDSYLSSSSSDIGSVWSVNFVDGNVYRYGHKTNNYYVRCISGP